jgi:hypothetical protein
MIGSDLEGADLESRVATWAAGAISDDAAAVRAVTEAYGDLLAAERTGAAGRSRSTCTSRCRSSEEGAAPASSESATRIRARSGSACGLRARRGSGCADVYLPVQGLCRWISA